MKPGKATPEPSLVSRQLRDHVIPKTVEPRESIPAPLRRSFSARAGVHEATIAARKFAENAAMTEPEASRLAIVVEELATNLNDHGKLNGDATFSIELSATAKNVSIVMVDPGEPFDPFSSKLDRGVPARGGGAGLKLVRTWANHTAYETGEGLNRLQVCLPRHVE